LNSNLPLLKRILSFIYEQTLEEGNSTINPSLELTLDQGRLKLNMPNAIYSFEDLYTAFSVSFHKLKIWEHDIKNVLMLGYGMGSIPVILKKNYNMLPHFTGVEIDEEIIRMAKKYMPDILESNVDLICDDAYQYVTTAHGKFDLIAVDIFEDDIVPKKFDDRIFVENVARLLEDNGLLLFNRMTKSEGEMQRTELYYREVFSVVFENASTILIHNNLMLVS